MLTGDDRDSASVRGVGSKAVPRSRDATQEELQATRGASREVWSSSSSSFGVTTTSPAVEDELMITKSAPCSAASLGVVTLMLSWLFNGGAAETVSW